MARRRREQFPKPKKEKGQWKIRYYTDQAQEDGIVRRVRKTKCLGRVEEMTLTEARKEPQRFLQPINDVEEGIEHSEKTMNQLIALWRQTIKPNLKLSTRLSYEWAFKRIVGAFGPVPVSEIEKAEVQAFLTSTSGELAPVSVRSLRTHLCGLLSVGEDWGWIQKNPARGRLKLPEHRLVRFKLILRPAQVVLLASVLGQPYRAVLLLAVLSGLREGELVCRFSRNGRASAPR